MATYRTGTGTALAEALSAGTDILFEDGLFYWEASTSFGGMDKHQATVPQMRDLVDRLPGRFDQADVAAWLNSLIEGWNQWTDVGQIIARETRMVHSAGFFGEDSQTQHWGLVALCREYVDTSGHSDVRHPAGDQVWIRVHEEIVDRV